MRYQKKRTRYLGLASTRWRLPTGGELPGPVSASFPERVMTNHTRREFFSQVGRGVLAATLGPSLATEFWLPPAFADDGKPKLTFGNLESLVALIEETDPARLLPILVK